MNKLHKVSPRDEAIELIECFIKKNGIKPGDKLPSERDMCSQWDMNRTTLRFAIKRLIEEGKLESRRGSGTYVAEERLTRNLQDAKSVTEAVTEAGHSIQSKVIDAKVIEATKHIAQKLQVMLGHKVFYIKRVRFLDNNPFSVESSYINYDFCKGIEKKDLNNASIYEALNGYGVKLSGGQESVGITYATEEEAKFLDIKEDTPMFFLTGYTTDQKNRAVEYFESVTRSDKVQFQTVLRRK